MKVYVSGPMTHYPEFNFPAFNKVAENLIEQGFEVVNPADKGIIPFWSWEDYLKYDIKELVDCDAIYTLEGWEESRGAQLEVHVATELGLQRMGAHVCDTGHFDRTLCPEPCDTMHSFCTTCGKRQDACALERMGAK